MSESEPVSSRDQESQQYFAGPEEGEADGTTFRTLVGPGLAFAPRQNSLGDAPLETQEDVRPAESPKGTGQHIEAELNQPTYSERDQSLNRDRDENILGDSGTIPVQGYGVNDQAANGNAWRAGPPVNNPKSGHSIDKALALADTSDPRTVLSAILKQQERILQMTQTAAINQRKAEAAMAQLGARIDQLSVQQRQLQSNWQRLRMEDQNRTQQNMGGN
jgi:hypothetical protein